MIFHEYFWYGFSSSPFLQKQLYISTIITFSKIGIYIHRNCKHLVFGFTSSSFFHFFRALFVSSAKFPGVWTHFNSFFSTFQSSAWQKLQMNVSCYEKLIEETFSWIDSSPKFSKVSSVIVIHSKSLPKWINLHEK